LDFLVPRDLRSRINLGIIDVHTEASAIFGSRSEVAYDREVDAAYRLGSLDVIGVERRYRFSPRGFDLNASAIVVVESL
jgi:hypothetical protein